MPEGVPPITADFLSLMPAQALRYEEIKELIADIANEDLGLTFLLNAIALTGDTAVTTMHMWSDVSLRDGMHPRDLAGIIYERPLSLPSFEFES